MVLGEMPDSKLVSLWVSSNATGPLLRYARQGVSCWRSKVNSFSFSGFFLFCVRPLPYHYTVMGRL